MSVTWRSWPPKLNCEALYTCAWCLLSAVPGRPLSARECWGDHVAPKPYLARISAGVLGGPGLWTSSPFVRLYTHVPLHESKPYGVQDPVGI